MRLRHLTAGAVVVGAAGAAIAIGQSRWRRSSDDLVHQLSDVPGRGPATIDFDRALKDVPPVVDRYFRAALRDGQPIIASARVTWRGEFNMGKPGRDNWRPFSAVQHYYPPAPGFIWDARIRYAPGMSVFVRDGFVNGQGTMRGALLGLIPVVNAEPSPALASGALQRYLGEAAWLPTALLPSQGIAWSPIDDRRARATIAVGTTAVSLEFTFDEQARLIRVFTPDRIMDDGKGHVEAQAWEAVILSHAERDGMSVPAQSAAAWLLPQGRFEYWRGEPDAIAYRRKGEEGRPVTRSEKTKG